LRPENVTYRLTLRLALTDGNRSCIDQQRLGRNQRPTFRDFDTPSVDHGNHGEELLELGSQEELEEMPIGCHIFNLLLKLEIYREHVDQFTSSIRKKYG
jgi:hypothetical protein